MKRVFVILASVVTSFVLQMIAIAPASGATVEWGASQQPCSLAKKQIHIDTSSRDGAICFDVAHPSFIRLDVTQAYGVRNRTDFDVSVAFRINEGAVFWQETLRPNGLRTLDVDRKRTRVIELMVGDPGVLSAPQSPGVDKLVSIAQEADGKWQYVGMNAGDDRARIQRLSLGSSFEDRLDATFKIRPALDRNQTTCFSLESVSYPGSYLTIDTPLGAVARKVAPQPQSATWCFDETGTGSYKLRGSYAGRNFWLQKTILGTVQALPSQSDRDKWVLHDGLGDPQS